MNAVILILYTTLYREGGDKFDQAAKTMARDKRAEFPQSRVVLARVESKKDFLNEIEKIARDGDEIFELHFIGHSGVYGIMFGTSKWPEQFSPHEWRTTKIPFAKNAKAYFHACRTARWFAPFFARTFGVTTYGHFWYTTISYDKQRFLWEGFSRQKQDCYVMSVAGRKSHGLTASLLKYIGRASPIPMIETLANADSVDSSYDGVSREYAKTFSDMTVRKDEWDWLTRHLQKMPHDSVLDIGCGPGSFLRQIAGQITLGVGVDASQGMIEVAQTQSQSYENLSFQKIDGPFLPFADDSFDVVLSVLSFRYLDWDPILTEILRVLKPGGEILVIDMVAAPVKLKEIPQFIWDKIKQQTQKIKHRGFVSQLNRMVRSSSWQQMLKYNPIRSEHEMKWYLESRFPHGTVQIINIGWNSRMLAFRSGKVFHKTIAPLEYP